MFSKSFLVWALLPFIGAVPAFSANESAPQAQKQASNEPIAVLPESGLPATWLQGTPVTHWEKDKVYVFEFWATWCGPCLAAIPHLDKTHREVTAKNLNAQIVGVNVRDRASPAMLKQFLAKLRVPPSYTVAVDTKKNTEELWARPRKIVGIPHALAVKNGTVIWAGHPMRLSTELIEAMTQPDFGEKKQEETPKEPDTDTLSKRLEELTALYASSDTEEADRELERFLKDETVPVSAKQDALNIPCHAALAQKDFQQMNASLHRKAEAFPQDPANLSAVARFILESNKIPEEEQDLDFAEECLKQILSITRDDKLRRQALRQLARVYELNEDDEARRNTLRELWQTSMEYSWLKQIEAHLKSLPEATEVLKIYAALDNGTGKLPVAFTAEAFPKKAEKQAQPSREADLLAFRKLSSRLRDIRRSKNQNEEEIKAFREELKPFPTLYMRATEILTSLAYARDDFQAAGKYCEGIMNEFPNVSYIAKMQLNVLNSDRKLRAATLPVTILAYRNIIGEGTPDASDYWQAISKVYAEMGDWENAVHAAFASRNASADWQAYKAN